MTINATPHFQSAFFLLNISVKYLPSCFVHVSKVSVTYINSLLKKNKAKKDPLMMTAKACQ